MFEFFEILKAIILGIVEGITEWLPISSTGHMILVENFMSFMDDDFKEMFFVVVQLGAILAVVLIYWNKLFPFSFKEKPIIKKDIFDMWFKIIVACIPAAIVGLLWDDEIDAMFYNYPSVAVALIVFGIWFIVIENIQKNKKTRISNIDSLTYRDAIIIGLFQLIAAVFPGTSRSGATIIGAMMIGVSRTVATEFTFFLAVPVMFGASLLKLFKFGFGFTPFKASVLLVGMASAFIVSIISIKFLTNYIKKNDFKAFGWYRIILGAVIVIYFLAFEI